MMYGSKAAKDKLKKTGGTAKKSAAVVLANKNKKTNIRKSAYAKLKNASTKAGAVKKLRSSGGSAITSKADQMKAYRKRMAAGQRKSVNQRKPRSY